MVDLLSIDPDDLDLTPQERRVLRRLQRRVEEKELEAKLKEMVSTNAALVIPGDGSEPYWVEPRPWLRDAEADTVTSGSTDSVCPGP